jgi:PIN domain nuclease of toxin-antitoxin system
MNIICAQPPFGRSRSVAIGQVPLRPRLSALPELLDSLGIAILSINERHALAAVEPGPKTREPFDRILF